MNFNKLPIRERFIFLECFLFNSFAKILIFCVPLKYSSKFFGKKGVEFNSIIASDADKNLYVDVMGACIRVFREVPWQSKCFDKSLTMKWMLGRRGLKSTIYFGVAKNPNKSLKAHAWVKCDNQIIGGIEGIKEFTIVEFFS